MIAGLPEVTSFATVIFGAAILLAATLVCQLERCAGDIYKGIPQEISKDTDKKHLPVLIVSLLLFSQTYSVGISLGVRTELNPNGIAGFLTIGFIVISAFI